MEARDIEGCHWIPLLRNSRGHDKRVIVKFVNRKHSAVLLEDKKRISDKNFRYLYVPNNVLHLCPFASTIDISGANVKFFKGKGKCTKFFVWVALSAWNYRRIQAQLNYFISAIFLTSLLTWILKMNFCKNGFCFLYIVKSLPSFCCEAIFITLPRTLIVTFLSLKPSHCTHLPQTGTDTLFILLIVATRSWYQDGFQPKDEIQVIVLRSKYLRF